MFCLGVYTLLAQMLVTRELAVLCLGTELTIGVVFSVWLILIGAGAGMVRVQFPFRHWRLMALFLWLAVMLPLVIVLLRLGAGWIRPVGEYPSLFRIFSTAVLVLLPICLPAGMVFSLACGTIPRYGGRYSVSHVYAIEAMGSFIAGLAFSFLLIERFCVVQLAFLGAAVSLVAAALVCGSRSGRHLMAVGVMAVTLCAIRFPVASELDWRSVGWRWAALNVTHEEGDGRPAVSLKAGFDTRYQNLALIESRGLFSVYGDGQVMFSFPDDIACERAVHFVMAQKPDARRVLLIGGNPGAELRYLLKYPVQEVVHVDRDPGVETLLSCATPGLWAELDHDPRLKRIHEDGPRFVKQCQSQFDVILVHSPEPVTGGLNRFFTREFYVDVSRILAPDGYMHTSVEASERLEQDTSRMAGSVYRTLLSVFPVVKVTAGSPVQFFASGDSGPLSLDRDVLYQRSLASKISFTHFRALYFLDADEISPEKVAFTEGRLQAAGSPVNTVMRPVSFLYMLVLWSNYSGSGTLALFRKLEHVSPSAVGFVLLGMGLVAGAVVYRARRKWPRETVRGVAWLAMAMTGLCGVSLEIILLYVFQGLYGYVYGRMGFMVGLFMLGTVAGAWQIRHIESAGTMLVRKALLACLVVLLLLAAVIPGILAAGMDSEGVLYGLTMAVGAMVGMQFVVVTRLWVVEGGAQGVSASRIWLGDYAGSAVGGLVAGVFLTPVLGITATCVLLAVGLGVMIGCFWIAAPPR